MTIVAAGTVIHGGSVFRPGWIDTATGLAGPGQPPVPPESNHPDGIVAPGFVDLHVHGGGGADYAVDPETAFAFHRSHGTVATLASLVTVSPSELLATVSKLSTDHRIEGIHLEGPWLSALRCGAHDSTQLRLPDRAEITAVLEAGQGRIRMVTLAPELPGAMDAIRQFTDHGVIVAIGHTDASYEQTVAAIDVGATVATHLFNAMRPLRQRDPGPALALLEDPRVTVELIADGIHLHPALVRNTINAVGGERVALVTDAMSAAGMCSGHYRLGTLDIDVQDAVARVAGTDTIAGSTATMDNLFHATVSMFGGAANDDALLMAATVTSATPARLLGMKDPDYIVLDGRAVVWPPKRGPNC
ncbi:N-acetylglucosamine-6-phosphate deacetylase [Smaragdicoccus niigatensis]|uniref:N-acetylglucosamine-6-phosphate deacetylase n=1 Tax=Smaragdicoccus niigatensis TaxID=359359 RepID=UPI00036E8D1A|nr:amidohydrolase family protein [Smaragdicoccus niigatensis]